MRSLQQYLKNNSTLLLYLLAFLLTIPALLINLGEMPLLADEPTRALVALEMYLSDNYVVPTINGEYYYNKPPLYNWLLVGLYHLTGSMNEWIIRIPTVASIFLFGIIVFFSLRKYSDRGTAIFVILAYITCGRVLFYDSFLGLIDTLFSALIFLNFMILYRYEKKGQYLKLFLFSYLIITICYFLKGLPALVFEFISLITLAFLRKKILLLFSKYHLIGIGILTITIILYYAQYLQYNSIETLIKTLINESTKRTVAEHSFFTSITHFFSFPFETAMHFLPWTLPLFLLIKKENRSYLLKNDFLQYAVWITITNIVVYWLSPETRPRYLFMFLPYLFLLSYVLFYYPKNSTFKKYFERSLLFLLILFSIGSLSIPFIPQIPFIENKLLKTVLISMGLLFTTFIYFKNHLNKLIIFCIALLILRIGFDWFVFPTRLQTEPQIAYRKDGIYVGQYTKDAPLYLYKGTPINHDVSFYISRERKKILSYFSGDVQKNTFYLTNVIEGELLKGKIHHQFHIAYDNTLLYLIRIEP